MREVILLAAAVLLFATRAALAAPPSPEVLRTFGGTYSANCTDPKALQLRLAPNRFILLRDRRGVEAKDYEEQRGYLGKSEPPGYVTTMVGQVKPGIAVAVQLFKEGNSAFAVLDGDPKVMGAFGLPNGDKTRYALCGASTQTASVASEPATESAEKPAAPAPAAPPQVAAKEPAGGASTNLDVLGVRIGMSPLQARPIMTAALPGAPFRESRKQLAFTGHNSATKTISGAEYISVMGGQGKDANGYYRYFVAGFSPEPGNERVFRIDRADNSAPKQSIGTFANVVDALAAKYGKPTVANASAPEILVWVFNADGKPRPYSEIGCREMFTASGTASTASWPGAPSEGTVQKLQAVIKDCGSTYIQVLLGVVGKPAADTLVTGLQVSISDIAGALSSTRNALSMINGAIAKDRTETVNQESKRKPAL